MNPEFYLHATLYPNEREHQFRFFDAIKNNQIDAVKQAITSPLIDINCAYIALYDCPITYDDELLINTDNYLVFTPLAWACLHQNQDIVNLLLVNNANVDGKISLENINIGNNNPATLSYSIPPLIAAVFSGDKEITSLLLSAGASLQCTNPQGYGPLHLAAYMAYPEIIQLLIQFGAEVNAYSKGDLAIDINEDIGNSSSELFNSDQFHHSLPPLHCLFFSWTAHPEPRLSSYDKTRTSDKKAYARSTKILLDAGADIFAEDDNNYCSLHAAINANKVEAVDYMLTTYYPLHHNRPLKICSDGMTLVHTALEADPDILFNVVYAFRHQITHTEIVVGVETNRINRFRSISGDCLAKIRTLPTTTQKEPLVCKVIDMIQTVESELNHYHYITHVLDVKSILDTHRLDLETVLALFEPLDNEPERHTNAFDLCINQYINLLVLIDKHRMEPKKLKPKYQKKLSDVLKSVDRYEPIGKCPNLLDIGSYFNRESKINFSTTAKRMDDFFFGHKNRVPKAILQQHENCLDVNCDVKRQKRDSSMNP